MNIFVLVLCFISQANRKKNLIIYLSKIMKVIHTNPIKFHLLDFDKSI